MKRHALPLMLLSALLTTVYASETLTNVKLDPNSSANAGVASLTCTEFDIGSVNNIFDGDVNSLIRTPNINPAWVEVAYNAARTFRGFRVHCTYGDSYDWWVETADTQEDLENGTGSYRLVVPTRNFPSGTWDQYTLPVPVTAPLVRLNVRRYGYDGYCHINEWELYGDVVIDSVRVSPTGVAMSVGDSRQFTAIGHNSAANEDYNVGNATTWSVIGGVGTVTTSGMFTATAAGNGSVRATGGALSGSGTVTVQAPNDLPDIDVLYIERTPRIAFNPSNTNYTSGLPAVGQAMSYLAHVKNWGTTSQVVPFEWRFNGVVTSTGSITIAPGQKVTTAFSWNWQTSDNDLQFVADPAGTLTEISKLNNSVTIRTNALLVGLWVEQSLYNYMHQSQLLLNDGMNGFEDWGQRMIRRWNEMMTRAVFPATPNGMLDRLALDKVVVVPDDALPLNGGLATNNPDSSDRTVDMMWGYPFDAASILPGAFYGFRWSGPFYLDFGSIHEMNHARYHIDLYGLDAHQGSDHPIQLTDDWGNLVAGTSYMPFIAWEGVHYNKYQDIMGGSHIFDQYSAAVWNWKHHKRGRGNMNSPPDIGVFLNDLPNQNTFKFVDQNGAPLAGAVVDVYQAAGYPSWYGKTFDNVADITRTADAAGSIALPRNPFGGSQIRHTYGFSNADLIFKVRYRGQLYFMFQEVTDFNIAYWRGATQNASYTRNIDLRDNAVSVPNAGWLVNFFNDWNMTAPVTWQTSSAMDFAWPGQPAPGVTGTSYAVYAQGNIQFTEGWKRFTVVSDGGVQILIDGRLVFDQINNTILTTWTPVLYTTGGAPYVVPGRSSVNGNYHRIEIRYRHLSGTGRLHLSWQDAPLPSSVPLSAWRADYYTTKTLSGYLTSRLETKIDNDYQNGSPDPSLNGDGFSARWTGDWEFQPGTYEFSTTVNDGMRLYVDGSLVMNRWSNHEPAQTYTLNRVMTPGVHRIVTEYYEDGGNARAKLVWRLVSLTYDGVVTLGDWAAPVLGVTLRMTVGAQSFNVTLDSQGRFKIPTSVTIPAGTYEVSLAGRSWLRATQTGVAFPLQKPLQFNLINGDVDQDGEIDDADLTAVILDFATPGGANGATDVDGSGEVDDADLTVVILNFGI